MPPCCQSPWCECGTRYDGGLVIYCDRHPPEEDGEATFAKEIYVNGNRWYLARETDSHASVRTASQQEENDLAQRLLHSTQASLLERDNHETSRITESMPGSSTNDGTTAYESQTTPAYNVPDDLRDVEIDESLFLSDLELLPNGQLDRFPEIDSNNGENIAHHMEEYYTPPTSPSQTVQSAFFNITQASQAELHEFVRGLPPSVLAGQQEPEIRRVNLIGPPHRLESGLTYGSGNLIFLYYTLRISISCSS